MKPFFSASLFKKAAGILVQYAANKCLVGNTLSRGSFFDGNEVVFREADIYFAVLF